MTQTPICEVEEYTEQQDMGHENINSAYHRLEWSPPPRVREIGIADPSTLSPAPAQGDGVIIGVGAVSTEFFGHDGELATYYAGWTFRTVKDGELIYDLNRELWVWFDPHFDVYRDLTAAIDTNVNDTGRNGFAASPSLIKTKVVKINNLPNTTTVSTAHSIAGLTLDGTAMMHVRAWAGKQDGTEVRVMNYNDGTDRITFKITATNIVVTTNFNASLWNGVFVFEYE